VRFPIDLAFQTLNRFAEEVCFAGRCEKTWPKRCFYGDYREIGGCWQQGNVRQISILGCLGAEMFQFENAVA